MNRLLIISLAFGLLLVSCKKEQAELRTPPVVMKLSNISNGNSSFALCAPSSARGANSNNSGETLPMPKKITKEGRIEIAVKDLKAEKSFIDSLIKKFNGVCSSENYSSSGRFSNYRFWINIPSASFDSFIAELESLGENKIKEKNISISDETENYVDLDSRLKTKKAYLERYRELLKKANSVKDVLEIQEQIRELEEDLESTYQSLKTIDYKVEYSTLSLTLSEEQAESQIQEEGFWTKISKSFVNGWNNFLEFTIALTNLWAFLIIIAVLLIFLIKRYKRGFKNFRLRIFKRKVKNQVEKSETKAEATQSDIISE